MPSPTQDARMELDNNRVMAASVIFWLQQQATTNDNNNNDVFAVSLNCARLSFKMTSIVMRWSSSSIQSEAALFVFLAAVIPVGPWNKVEV